MKNILFLFLLFSQAVQAQYAQLVNPFIGTGGHGHTFPGATAPFGFCQLSPDTRIDGSWDGCGGYHYSDSIIFGFSHTHLSGTGVSDYGDILLMPVTKAMLLNDYQYKSTFNHKNESAEAGYYQVFLNEPQVNVELTTSRRGGFHKYTYPKDASTYVVLDLKHRDQVLESKMEQVDEHTIRGYRFSKAWATNQKIFFEIKFEQEIEGIQYEAFDVGTNTTAIFTSKSKHALIKLKKGFTKNVNPAPYQVVRVKVGLSGVDEEGAHANLEKEIPHWDFEKTKKWVQDEWNRELGKIVVGDSVEDSSDKKIIFYSALYHCMIAPNIYSDNDNRYRGRDDKIHNTEGKFDYYTVFSLWDTYRALHPLLTIIDKKRTNDFINTFIKQYEQGGRLPVWELSSNETNCMIGYHAVSVIWDAYNKGIRDYDAEKAFEAMKSIATEDIPGVQSYMKFGYVRAEDDHESVSKTLEYAYDDWCIAQMAKALGKDEDYKIFEKRSHNWINVYDPTSGFMRARKNSALIEPFSPYLVDNNYTEANAWQYSFYVPHDLQTLYSLLYNTQGEYLNTRLDKLFAADAKTEGRLQADITGLIGQYAHGNEPSHHIANIYHLFDHRAKGDSIIKRIKNEFYTNAPDGYIGNEDCGQMSAWFVLNAIGIYSFCPGVNSYITTPMSFDNCVLNRKTKLIQADMEKYHLDRKRYEYELANYKISHSDLVNNKECTLYLGGSIYPPPGRKAKYASPFITAGHKVFTDTMKVSLNMINSKDTIFYSFNNSPYELYTAPLVLSKNCHLSFYGITEYYGNKSPIQTATFTKLPNDREVFLNCTYGKTYHAGGPMGLVDGIHGTENWRAGEWQGYQGQDFEAVIKYTGEKEIKTISATFLQDQKPWIFMPKNVSFYVSNDSVHWTLIEQLALIGKVGEDDRIFTEEIKTEKPIRMPKAKNKAIYYKVHATNYGVLPSWHPGSGNPAYIFIDEIELK